ncbi:serine/threonine-protein kinase 19 [Callorhinchus milii]|uniref:Serine/threonine-protein kinase 19-like protein n=1 Tax=Callorhinchus milii TaxID=7868 RepID=V9KKL0_CALMI|nr:serine/threonine-protein kinase 19 [Callorhinchus milii]XP_042196923.1 serine/threonine-protein kinase 19 [Callorhinchus milii]|eukprot:gi/632952382/ref/XP_007891820.1/ PREDICTED: serine/threonine-protein kinase 19 [Callorhinchus milii]
MNRKRILIPQIFKQFKKRRLGAEDGTVLTDKSVTLEFEDMPNDTKTGLLFLVRLFPRKLFDDCLPPIVLKHQLYSIVKDKTTVDRQLNELKDLGVIRMFNLGFDTDVFGIVFSEDYKSKVLAATATKESSATVQRFLETVLTSCTDIGFNQEKMLKEFSFQDQEITQLVNAGVFTVRDVGSWWLSIPGAGRFVKYFVKGRKAVLNMIRKSKYKEVLQSDLELRKITCTVKLGIQYQVHDIIGAELVKCIPTTTGTLLRLNDT